MTTTHALQPFVNTTAEPPVYFLGLPNHEGGMSCGRAVLDARTPCQRGSRAASDNGSLGILYLLFPIVFEAPAEACPP